MAQSGGGGAGGEGESENEMKTMTIPFCKLNLDIVPCEPCTEMCRVFVLPKTV